MESILGDTTRIQNKTNEYGCVGIVADFPHKKNIPKQSQKEKNLHHLGGSVVICILLEIVRSDIISAIFVTKI